MIFFSGGFHQIFLLVLTYQVPQIRVAAPAIRNAGCVIPEYLNMLDPTTAKIISNIEA
jgi:hypothetical protein